MAAVAMANLISVQKMAKQINQVTLLSTSNCFAGEEVKSLIS
jgi:hypothetical protein